MIKPLDRQALIDGARFAYDCSRKTCAPTCRDYHGIWVYSRLLGILPSVDYDSNFLLSAFRAAAELGARRILISGAADSGMLSYLLEAYQQAGLLPQVTVIDKCASPLAVNAWYAERQGIDIATIKTDVLELDAAPFDLVVTHSFMNGFAEARRPDVVRKWKALLKSGGRLITANVIMENAKPADTGGRVRRFSNADLDSLVQRYLQALADEPCANTIEPAQLEDLVRGFAASREVFPVTSVEALTGPILGEGFEIIFLESGPRTEPGKDGAHSRFRTRLIAVRP